MDTGDVQVGLRILENQVEGIQKTVDNMDDKLDKLPTPTDIENAVLKGFEAHIEKKHKGLDLFKLIPFFILGSTSIGALILALLG